MRLIAVSSKSAAMHSARERCLRRAVWAGALVGCAGLALEACGKASSNTTTAGGPTKVLSIVAGENFWGSVVSQLAGKAGKVTSIVTDPNTDPHNYEASSDNARAFADADYVVLNGAGYDKWAEKLISGNPSAKRKVLTIADVLGKKEGDNPHFWYDPDYVARVADKVAADLKNVDATDAGYFDAQLAAFDAALAPMRARLGAIKSKFAGTPVASTESIFLYLGDYLGLKTVSPPEFMQAVAEGNDPPAPSVATFEDELSKREAKVLVYSRQTSTAVTTNLKQIATDRGIPVIGVTETIQPPDATFQEWFGAELIDLQNALNAAALTGSGAPPSPSTTGG